jgi:hypothetical protein
MGPKRKNSILQNRTWCEKNGKSTQVHTRSSVVHTTYHSQLLPTQFETRIGGFIFPRDIYFKKRHQQQLGWYESGNLCIYFPNEPLYKNINTFWENIYNIPSYI